MDTSKIINALVEDYLVENPAERSKLSLLITQLSKGDDVMTRRNFTGHVTASGIIFSPDKSKVLLIYHKKLQKYLQPGGHFDSKDVSPLDTCIREIEEETGLKNLYLLDFSGKKHPIDIDTHYIPENINKNEPEHFHHDFRFVFVANSLDINVQEEEVRDYKWIEFEDARKINTFEYLFSKIELLNMEKKPAVFFQEVVSNTSYNSDINFIVVTHILPDRPALLSAIANIGKINCIIPKPNSINRVAYEQLAVNYEMLHLTKKDLLDSTLIAKRIKDIGGKVIILDIGGYFANCINALVQEFPGKILGVIEDTENGHQKYEDIAHLELPVISVARSPLKMNEDTLVGQSIVFSADFILRENNLLMNHMNAGVIGYGRIGSSISNYLLRNNIFCDVYDSDPIKRIEAINKGCSINEKNIILSNSDILFCATGNYSLRKEDLRLIKNGAYIISVTSSDDEMEIGNIDKEYKKVKITNYIDKYFNEFNYFYLVNQGNAINFINNAVVGNFIFLVQSEILGSVEYLMGEVLKDGICELPIERRKIIAGKWISIFGK